MAQRQLLPFGLDDAPSSSVTQYMCVTGAGEVSAWTSTEAETRMCIPTAGVLTSLWMKGSAAPGAGKSNKIITRVNSANTSLELNFVDTDTLKESLYLQSVSAGDLVNFSSVPTGSPSAAKYYGAMEFRPTNPAESILLGNTGDVSLGGTLRYCCLHASANGAVTAFDVSTLISNYRGGYYGTLTKFRVALDTAPGGVASRTFEIYHSVSGATGITITISGTSTSGSTTGALDLHDGEYIYIQATASGSPATAKAYFGAVIEPEVVGEYLIASCSGATLSTSTSAYEYNMASTGNDAWGSAKATKANGSSVHHYMRSIGMALNRSPSTVSDTRGYEIYAENPSAIGNRAFVSGLNTYANSGEFLWGARIKNTWNVRSLAFNSSGGSAPRVANAIWSTQMRYLPN